MSLQQIASQLSRLKANTPERAGLILYASGALYSAFEAKRHGFVDRNADPNRWRVELKDTLLADISKGRRPAKSTCVSIVHFNSALIRIDVGFERLVRYVTRSSSGNIKALLESAKRKGISMTALRSWERVRHQEVNKLKHRNPSSLARSRMKYAEMVKALHVLVGVLAKHL